MSTSTNPTKKTLFIGDYSITNCTSYGEYETIDAILSGEELQLEYEPCEEVIVVKSKKASPQPDKNKQPERSDKEWVMIGEVVFPDQIKKVMVPLLRGKYKEVLFECRVISLGEKVAINDRFRISIWARQKELSPTVK